MDILGLSRFKNFGSADCDVRGINDFGQKTLEGCHVKA